MRQDLARTEVSAWFEAKTIRVSHFSGVRRRIKRKKGSGWGGIWKGEVSFGLR